MLPPRLEAACESYGVPPIDVLSKAAAEMPLRGPEPGANYNSSPPAPSAQHATGSPDLKSAEAINTWLAQAQQKVNSIFSDAPVVDNHRADVLVENELEMKRPTSSSSTGSLAATVPLGCEEAATSSNPAPHVDTKADLLVAGTTESSQAADARPVVAVIESTCDAVPTTSTVTPLAQVGLGGSTAAPSDAGSDHFSEDDFEEADAEEDSSFDASLIDGGIASDRGSSEASLSIVDSRQVSGTQIDEIIDASHSRKVIGLGATNASISYDEDFEADVDDEEDTLGASIGGA